MNKNIVFTCYPMPTKPYYKIAFLFLIYDIINHEDLWYNFFKNINPSKYIILIHYKISKELKYFEKSKLKNIIDTKYADISLVKAHNILLTEALKDPFVYKCINVSGSCIPLKSFDYIYNKLTKDNNSYFTFSNFGTQYEKYNKYIRENFFNNNFNFEIKKSHQWFILNRKHANDCITHTEFIKYYEIFFAPEESYFISIVNKYNSTDFIINPENFNTQTTFTNWGGYKNYKFNATSGSLKNYNNISKEELNLLLSTECLFARKFNYNCMVDNNISLNNYLKNIINPNLI